MSSRSTFSCLFSLFFLASLASSQVIIREKVEVKPNPARSLQGTLASELRVESSFDGPVDPTYAHFVYVKGPCDENLVGDISGVLTAPALDGFYTIGYTVTSPSGGGFRFAVYLGDSLLWLTEGPVACPNGCTLKSERIIRLYAGFTFWPQYALIGSGATNYFGAAESTATAPCSSGSWYGEWPIELEITKGQDVGIFVDGAVRSYKVVKKKSDFYTLTFVADGEKGYGDVEITARSGGLTVVKGFKVVAPAPTVRIVSPWWWRGDPITLAFDNLPILDFTETHTPRPGQKFEPVITWDPNDTINTADYYNVANELYVKVRAENAGGVARDSVKLEFETDCIKVNFDPPELSTGDTARLSFQRVNEDGTLQDLPLGSYAFSVMIVGGEDSSKGLFVTEEESPYEEPKIGTELLNETSQILYVAPATIQESPMKAQVIASAWELMWWKKGETGGPEKAAPEIQSIQGQGKENAKGARLVPAGVPQNSRGRALEAVMKAMSSWCPISEVTVKRNISLQILVHSPWSLWPYLPQQRNGKSRGADRPGYNAKRSFRILVLDGSNEPAKNEVVRISTMFQDGSGGHQHAFGEPHLPEGTTQGVLYGQNKGGNPLTLSTDENGFAVVDLFIASQISGKYLVTASLASDPTTKDTVNLEVRVPGLVDFRDLIVLNERPFTFAQSDTGTGNHPNNTWCATEMGNRLFLGILDFYEWTRSPKGGGKAVQTSINDMSLVWGGLFDIKANWNIEHPSHSLHRVGLGVDINRGAMNGDQLDELTRDVKLRHATRDPERPMIHYEFDGGN